MTGKERPLTHVRWLVCFPRHYYNISSKVARIEQPSFIPLFNHGTAILSSLILSRMFLFKWAQNCKLRSCMILSFFKNPLFPNAIVASSMIARIRFNGLIFSVLWDPSKRHHGHDHKVNATKKICNFVNHGFHESADLSPSALRWFVYCFVFIWETSQILCQSVALMFDL